MPRAAAASVPAALKDGGYGGLTFHAVARLSGLDCRDVQRVCPSKADMVLAAFQPALPAS